MLLPAGEAVAREMQLGSERAQPHVVHGSIALQKEGD